MRKDSMMIRGRRAGVLAAALVGATFAAGCEVTNPGPVEDEYMTLPSSQQGFVNGARERLTRALGQIAYTNALVAREIFPGGQTGSYGHSVQQQAGSLLWSSSSEYATAQQARWVAEEAIRKFAETGDVPAAMRAQAHTWAGYANRVLGENWCEAVFDGGPLEAGIKYFERAEAHFTAALDLNPPEAVKLAAHAGRAQVRLWRENWAGAASDAAQVDDNFVWLAEMDFSRGGDTSQRNHIYWASANTPYRNFTVRYTYYDKYYEQTGDPRTPWNVYATSGNLRFCSASLSGHGQVACSRQLKYVTQDDDMRLASGPEMRLIEAEALLAQGQWQAAMAKINAVRTSYTSDKTGQKLQPWTASNATEAWTALKRERGIELWLEGRRMGDQRRWEPILGQQKTPGDLELPDFEARSTVFTIYPRGRPIERDTDFPRVLCFNISNRERNQNPNIPDVDDDG